ncbi:uncharacterized protein EURHEDRAFT_445738 [Aspergillus ruber CBS 135680]|uniref:non-specific serine/threonine protein kinase n=1 Tax=Aspergillus ruber (strain CBS 135680) TaxID=1388766 RepID=A0A017ST00_ASPRC|nr:uncharacterized protein EURHEDRAFT_445738 [Aspergillus ruber CBS 135680]EYE99916.1 hypothetical protein EURHEDRAFT_445738 [Aspergillus ruber CBS 135680]
MSTPAILATPTRQPERTAKRRTVSRRVYGKRKADAPRAVFEHKSPPKETAKGAGDVVVDGLQAKMASITIKPRAMKGGKKKQEKKEDKGVVDAFSVPRDEEEPVKEESIASKPVPDTAEIEPQIEVVEQPPPESTTTERQCERMFSIEISPRKPESELNEHKPLDESATQHRRRAAPARKKKPAPRLSSGCVQDEKANEYAHSILNEALSPIAAQGVQKFGSWAARGGNMLQVVKLAEGSYGEVYKMRLREEVCKQEMSKSKLAKLRAYGDGVFKVVPLRAVKGLGSKKFTSVDEIVSEVKMLKYLDPIPGFARFREIHVVQGRFPESFQEAWDYYKKTKDDCMNPNPANKRAYPDSQMWAIIEMDDAGCELEKFSWSSVFQIYDIFWGVAMALARAEEYALFEHRDLHLGNVCIRSARSDGRMDPPTDLEIVSRTHSSGYGFSTLETTLIDYSLSRAELRLNEDPNAPPEVASSDLDKKQLFDAIGHDEDDALLRDTYRHMRSELYTGNPANPEKPADVPGIWSEYAPGTNIVWLRFLLKNLLKNKKDEIRPTQPQTTQRKALAPCSPNKQNIVISKQSGQKQGKGSGNRPLVQRINIAEAQLQATQWRKILDDRLEAVLDLLDLEHRHEDMCCAADLVAYAIDSQWLEERDFF